MTQPRCHYDRATRQHHAGHRDDCTNHQDHDACAPCTAHHCQVCNRTHATNDNPHTCTTCLPKIRDDLAAINTAYNELADEAIHGGRDGRLTAAAPIPGGTATVLRGPAKDYDDLIRTHHLTTTHADYHHPDDPTPPLAVLGAWEDTHRAHLGLAARTHHSLAAAIAFHTRALTDLAQDPHGPDFGQFARDTRTLRTQLEHALHDEQSPQRGVECFECGEQLVRRFRDPVACRHWTPARRELHTWLTYGYPEAVTQGLRRAALRPCGDCDQGGIRDPAAGLSWECPGCRKDYTAGEYTHAVRRDLLEGGENGDGWTHIAMAAEAASTMTGTQVPSSTIRKWMDRGRVASCCLWEPGRTWGVRLVYWPDVAEVVQSYAPRLTRRKVSA